MSCRSSGAGHARHNRELEGIPMKIRLKLKTGAMPPDGTFIEIEGQPWRVVLPAQWVVEGAELVPVLTLHGPEVRSRSC